MSTLKTINVQHPSSASANITLDNSGNVGIGTSSPSVKLDVQQTVSGGAGLTGRVYNPDTGATSAAYITAYQGTIQTGIYSYGNSGSYVGAISNNFVAFITNNTERMRLDTSGNLLFNSGYGSVATAYGCRAWVNFDAASGTPTIVESGNVSAVADLGVGSYRVDFDVDLPDGDFSIAASSAQIVTRPSAPLAASVTLQTGYPSSLGGAVTNVDTNNVSIIVVR